MEALDVLTEERLYCFLQKHGDNQVKRELLIFWGMHPNARFDDKLIYYAMDCGRLDAERVLRTMVEEGLLDKHTSNDVTLYSLTKDEERRRQLLALTTLGWDRWHLMVKRIEQREKVA